MASGLFKVKRWFGFRKRRCTRDRSARLVNGSGVSPAPNKHLQRTAQAGILPPRFLRAKFIQIVQKGCFASAPFATNGNVGWLPASQFGATKINGRLMTDKTIRQNRATIVERIFKLFFRYNKGHFFGNGSQVFISVAASITPYLKPARCKTLR